MHERYREKDDRRTGGDTFSFHFRKNRLSFDRIKATQHHKSLQITTDHYKVQNTANLV